MSSEPMGQVVPFIARVRDSGDWTASERARLQELADRLSAGGVEVDVIFGATDEGDPWCVVTDGNGDVLIHVARIGGAFVVHSAVDDAVNENVDLHTALRDHLDATEAAMAPQSATILPFGMSARQGQTFLALVVAASFFYETAGIGGEAEAAELPRELPTEPSPPPPETDAPTQERELATQGATLHPTSSAAPAVVAVVAPVQDSAPAPHEEATAPAPAAAIQPAEPVETPKAETPLPAPAKAEAPVVIHGTDGDDMLVGTSANEHIIGGAGNDTLRGGGGHDLLEGGAGDDRIELASGVTAVGGAGADTFVIQAPVQLGHAETLLGVVLDFSALDGDRLALTNGRFFQVPQRPITPGVDDKTVPPTVTSGEGGFTAQGGDPSHPTLSPDRGSGGDFGTSLVGPPLTRLDVDVDGDGVVDGYVLVGVHGHALDGQDNPIVITGRAPLGGDDIFG
jgi:Ca2+-binding RTX toxin-like protein